MNIDLEIELLLDDINENENGNIDKEELIMYLSSVEEAIFIIKNLLLERNL